MEFQILSQIENKNLGRKEIKVLLNHEGLPTPKRLEVLDSLASTLKVDKNLLIVFKIKPKYGRGISFIEARLYSSEGQMKKFEPKYVIGRHTGEKKRRSQASGEKKEEAKK